MNTVYSTLSYSISPEIKQISDHFSLLWSYNEKALNNQLSWIMSEVIC